jgi:beta-glucanase (GH16 family)
VLTNEKANPSRGGDAKLTDLREVAELPKSEKLPKVNVIGALVLIAAFGAILVVLSAGTAKADGTSFRDDFSTFDSSRWLKSDHVLGRTDFAPENVVVNNDRLGLLIPANTTNGAEIESVDYYGHGTYKARIRTADAPSSITGFFLYRSPDYHAEIDIEIYNDGTGKVDFVTYADGQRTHYVGKDFRFDPSAGFHTYRLDYLPSAVKFYVDGDLKQVWTDGIPQGSMKLMVNTWFPSWLKGIAPSTARTTRVEFISYEQL